MDDSALETSTLFSLDGQAGALVYISVVFSVMDAKVVLLWTNISIVQYITVQYSGIGMTCQIACLLCNYAKY